MRKKVAYTLLIIIAALLLAIPVMSIVRTRITQWTLLKTTSWVSIEAEKTIYGTADSNHFFIHFRITNQTSHPIAIDLKARNGMWGIFHSFKWNIGQGDGRAPSCSRLIPISLGLNPHEKKMLLTDYKAGKLTTIAPHESVDYYRASQSVGRAEIAKKWSAISLLQKSKTYYPLFPSAAQNLQITVRGMIRLTDGTQIKCPEISELYVSFPFPLHWKQIPVNGRIVN